MSHPRTSKIAIFILLLGIAIALTGVRNIIDFLLGKVLWGISFWNLPQIDGTVLLNTSFPIKGNIKITTDKYGVPHIYAEHSMDVIFGQGYIHAQERLWQMEIVRRVATGTLGEIVPEGLEADRLSRTFGFHRLGKIDVSHHRRKSKTGELELNYVEAYVKGINAYIRSPEFRKPIEFIVLDINPADWKEDEVAAISRLLAWQMSRGWHYKIANYAVTQLSDKFPVSGAKLTKSIIDSLFDLRENVSPTTLPIGDMEINWDRFDEILQNQPPLEQGSNAWVVSGKYTGGKPILASDPHLVQSLPSVWYQNHLVAQQGDKIILNVMGVSMAGCPFVLIGHNAHIAWGITLSYADVTDIYLEKLSGDKKTYEFQGVQKPVQEIDEIIQVKGQKEPFIEKVRITHHGPILSGLVNYSKTAMDFAISATYLKENMHIPMEPFLELNQAKNAREAREALLRIQLLSLNIVFADDDGNIGYQMTGEVPIRTKHAIEKPNLPLLGWDGKSEWQGYIDIKENPAAINPKQGFIISANHRIVGPEYKYYLGSSFKYGSRAIRIKEMLLETLKNKNKVTLNDFATWQNDVTESKSVYGHIVSLIKRNLVQLEKIPPLEQNVTHEHVVECLRLISDFNGELDKNSVKAGLYIVYTDQLFKILMGKLGLEENVWLRLKGCGLHPSLFAVNEYFGHEVHTIEKLSKIPEMIEIKDLYNAMIETIFLLRKLLNLKQAPQDPHEVIMGTGFWNHIMKRDRNITIDEEINLYKYGNFHQLYLQHAFGKMISEFNRGPYPVGGSAHTLNMGAPYPDGKSYIVKINPSFRMLVDLGNISKAISIFAPGQSGHLASSHYNDYTAKFVLGEYNEMLFMKQDIEKNKEGTLELVKKKIF